MARHQGPTIHHSTSIHSDLKKTYDIPASAIVWHSPSLHGYFQQLLPLADDPRATWRFDKQDTRPRKLQRSRLGYYAQKVMDEKGRLSHGVLLLLDEATKMNLRPCLGFSDMITDMTEVQTLVWMPKSEFSFSKSMRGGTPTESKAFRRMKRGVLKERGQLLDQQQQKTMAELNRVMDREQVLSDFKVTIGVPEEAVWCRDGKCDRFYVLGPELALGVERPCFKCTNRKRPNRYWVSDRYNHIEGV
jgi:hypothetical protein